MLHVLFFISLSLEVAFENIGLLIKKWLTQLSSRKKLTTPDHSVIISTISQMFVRNLEVVVYQFCYGFGSYNSLSLSCLGEFFF